MVASTKQDTLVLRRKFAASPDTLFQAWTDPQHMCHWFAPEDKYSNPFIEVDLREGGEYRIAFQAGDKQPAVVGGRYVTVRRPEKLVFTWQWENPHEFEPHETLVTVEFLPSGDGTELVLTHERFPNQDMLGKHTQGWTGCLQRLERALAQLKKSR